MSKKGGLPTVSEPRSAGLHLDPLSTRLLTHLRIPRFDVVELTRVARDPDEEAFPTPPLDGRGVRATLWNASIRETDRLAGARSPYLHLYAPHDLVRVPRQDVEARLWTVAYPKGQTAAAGAAGPKTRLRTPKISDERRWRSITLGEFHRQRRFYGLVEVEGRVHCIRTLDDRRMLRIPLADLGRVAPLFRRMIDPPWFPPERATDLPPSTRRDRGAAARPRAQA